MSNNGITVTATGASSGSPDRAILTLGATAVRGEVAAALGVVNGKLENLISTLAGYGIEGPDIQTSDLSIWPERNNEGAVSGFRVRNTVKISTSDLERLGEVTGASTAVLGDLAEMHGLAFEVADGAPLEAQARARAWDRALDKARQLAGPAGTRLGQAIDITETSGQGPGPMPKRAMAMAVAEAASVEVGSASREVRLLVRFAQFPDDHASG
ncbi:MAG TPA: SIMPL domain-containing protein [Acidimicrobiia bacterium]|nr:SIMPL domain-containing protein [Acidimicrobiia bacterium]